MKQNACQPADLSANGYPRVNLYQYNIVTIIQCDL